MAGSLAKIEIDALFHQPLDTASAVADSEFHSLPAAQAGSGCECVGHMGINGIPGVEHGSHAALRPKS